MIVNIPLTVWVTNPADVVTMDPDQPLEFFKKLHLDTQSKEDLSYMAESWLYVGTAQVKVILTEAPEAIRQGAIERLEAKLKELDAEHERRRTAFQAAVNKLQALGWNGK